MATTRLTWVGPTEFAFTTRERAHDPGLVIRLRARLFASRYDQAIEAGTTPIGGSALAVHHTRLTSARERTELIRTLRLVTSDAAGHRGPSLRVPVRADAVRHAAGELHALLQRLDEPQPVRPRGMARLRLLLADGRGPLYSTRAGSLNAALRGVLAAL